MRLVMTVLIVFQILGVCFMCYGLGYAKCKLPKWLLYANIGLLILDMLLIIRNIYML